MKPTSAPLFCPLPLAVVWLVHAISLARAQSPPRLLPQAFDLERVVPEGTNVQLPCPVEADPDTLFFEWYRDKEPLDTFGEERYRVATSGILRIKAAIPEDTGLYVCRAVNGFGRVDVNVTLIVLGPPDTLRSAASEDDDYDENFSLDGRNIFKGDGEEQEEGFGAEKGKPRLTHVSKFHGSIIQRLVGTSITLKCVATADPRPQVSWLKNGKPLPDGNLPSSSRKGRWTLHLQNLQASDTGNYTCLVYNGMGSVSASFAVKVIDRVRSKPEIISTYPHNVTARNGDTASLQCLMESDIPPHVQWLKQIDEANVNAEAQHYNVIKVQGEHYRILKSSEVTEKSDGSFLNKLIIPEARERDSGKYICLGANTMGYSFKSAFLTVLARSSPHQMSQPNLGLPFPIVIAIAVSATIVLAGMVGLLLYCRSRRSPPSSRVTTATTTTTTTSSKGSVSTDTKHSYVGMAYHPQITAIRDEIGAPSPARMYIPSGQLHRTVPLNSIFL